jgi:hypothetical protein
VVIYEKEGRYFWRCIERLLLPGRYGVRTSKYTGSLLLLGDRIIALEYETLLKTGITQAILYPSYQTSVSYLIGIQTGMPLIRGRRPGASIVLMEHLGKSVDPRQALRACGIFDQNDPAIDPGIRSLIANRIPEGSFVLETEDV